MILDLVTKRGFFCDDSSIQFPYKPSTVSSRVLVSICFYAPLLIYSVLEWWRLRSRRKPKYLTICGRKFHPLLRYIPCTLFVYYFGYYCNLGLTYLMKLSIGRPRPHFIDVCQPDWSMINCSTPEGHPAYVDPIPCNGTDETAINQARLSFPSGHASISAYAMVYFIMYLQAQFYIRRIRCIKPLLQLICIVVALFISLTRIQDFKHHSTDVMAGLFLGTFVAVLVVTFVSDIIIIEEPMRMPKIEESVIDEDEKSNLYERIPIDDVD
ncbi:unnamed protein product, partial [Meganyctiphanes norvegica]